MGTEYIKKEDALNAFSRVYMIPSQSKAKDIYREQIENTYLHIKSIPAADVVERKHGKYSAKVFTAEHNIFFDAPLVSFWCHECDYTDKIIADRLTYKFCPNCGADMRGDDDV